MSDQLNMPTPGAAATRVAHLFRYGNVPGREEEAHARMVLAASRIDKEVRASLAASPIGLGPVYAAHLVGLLLAQGQSDEKAVERCARVIREALFFTPSLTAEDRAEIARMVLGGE